MKEQSQLTQYQRLWLKRGETLGQLLLTLRAALTGRWQGLDKAARDLAYGARRKRPASS